MENSSTSFMENSEILTMIILFMLFIIGFLIAFIYTEKVINRKTIEKFFYLGLSESLSRSTNNDRADKSFEDYLKIHNSRHND